MCSVLCQSVCELCSRPDAVRVCVPANIPQQIRPIRMQVYQFIVYVVNVVLWQGSHCQEAPETQRNLFLAGTG